MPKLERLSTITREELIHQFVKLLLSDNATVFIGAGLSLDAGLPSWDKLMEIPRKSLNDGEKPASKSDFYDIADKYVQKSRGRTALTDLLIEKLTNHNGPSENHKIITRLPLSKIWTTNFDTLIENAYLNSGKKIYSIKRDMDFTFSVLEDVKLYKVHGCITIPDQLVITKGDLQAYERNYEVMAKAFFSALAEDTFLFLGFSFTDQNFEKLLGMIRVRYSENARKHFAVLKKPEKKKELTNFQLFINSLSTYGIKTWVIEDFAEISLLLKDIEKCCIRKNIFISGSFDKNFHKKELTHPFPFKFLGDDLDDETDNTYPKQDLKKRQEDIWKAYRKKIRKIKDELNQFFPYKDSDILQTFLHKLGSKMIEDNFNIYTGFGSGVCDVVVESASELFKNRIDYPSMMERMKIFPLPIQRNVDEFHSNFYSANMLGACGIMIIARGGTYTSDYTSGTFEEYQIAKGLSKLLHGKQKQVFYLLEQIQRRAQKSKFDPERDKSKYKFNSADLKSLAELYIDQKRIVTYQFLEIVEIFYRTLYEQWKVVIRSIDRYKKLIRILINKKRCLEFEYSKIEDITRIWIELIEMLRNLVLARTVKFYSLFENVSDEEINKILDNGEINVNFKKNEIQELIQKVNEFHDQLNKLLEFANNNLKNSPEKEYLNLKTKTECLNYVISFTKTIAELIKADLKYFYLTEWLTEYNLKENIVFEKIQKLSEEEEENSGQNESLNIDDKLKNSNYEKIKKESVKMFKDLWVQILTTYNTFNELEKNNPVEFKQSENYALKVQIDYLLEKTGKQNISITGKKYLTFIESFNNEGFENKFEEYISEIEEKYIVKDYSLINRLNAFNKSSFQEETQERNAESLLTFCYVLRIQKYKILLLLADVIGGLQKVKGDYETIQVAFKTNQNEHLLSTIYGVAKSEPQDIVSERTFDAFFYNPNKYGKYIEYHERYITNYHYQVQVLKKMIIAKNIFKKISNLFQPEKIHKERSLESYIEYVENKAEKIYNILNLELSDFKKVTDELAEIEANNETEKNNYKGLPYRSGTIIIPIAAFGGMAKKIWKEERIRFDYLCSNEKNFSISTRRRLMNAFDKLATKYFNQHVFTKPEDDKSHIEEEINKLLGAIFFIIQQFQQAPRVGVGK